jgi:nitrate/nitrite transport system substrate-binding protein
MPTKSLSDPFNADNDLRHGSSCRHGHSGPGHCGCFDADHHHGDHEPEARVAMHRSSEPEMDTDALMDRAVESAIVRAMFGHNEIDRRRFLKLLGGGTMAAALASVLPMDKVKAAAKDSLGPLEKKKLRIGFVPITCATPIIMAHPMGFYERYGLDVEVIKTAGWAVARDMSLSGQYDASHMLSPMPLAMSMGIGSTSAPFIMPAVENINGQAITLHNKHKDKRDPKDWKGFRFAVPFEYSMHNFLLRYYVAEHGLDPDQDIQIRVVPPPEMVANLRAENVDGYLAPDPFNQRAVWEQIGFIHMLTKDIWNGHPCCAFACSRAFAEENPNTFGALLRAIVEATQYSSDPANRVGDRRGDLAARLPQPAGPGGAAGADRPVRRRSRQHPGRARPDRLRPVPLAFDGHLDPDADEALGLHRGRRELQPDRRAGVPGHRMRRRDARAGIRAPGKDGEELHHHGQGVRLHRPRGVREELRDREGLRCWPT